jgi:3-hydroxyisobutyrate dehydrogenase-like beta-hydroxyacid dehydrogenase
VVVMVGASDADYQRATDILETFARRVFHLGLSGSGSRMKLIFNMVLGLNRAVLAESLVFAEHYELQMEQVLEILKDGAAYSKVMEAKGPKMLQSAFQPPEARLSQHLKDVRLMLQEAALLGARTPFTEIHEKLLEAAEQLGLGNEDNSAVIEVFRASYKP